MRTSRSRVLVVALLVLLLVPGIGHAVPDELTDRLEAARAQLAELDTRVSAAVEDYNTAASRLEQLRAQQAETADRVDALSTEVAELEATTAGFVRSMYIRGPAADLTVALGSDEVTEAGRDLAVVDRLARQRHAQLERLGASRTELVAARGELAAQVESAAARERELADRRTEVEAMVADQRDDITALQDQIAEIEAEERAEAERRRRAAAERAAREAVEQAAAEGPEQTATEAAPEPEPTPEPRPAPAPAPPGTRQGADVAVDAALSQLGKPYEYGAAGPDSYDCSGLTQWAWNHAGVSLPHSSRMQYAATTRITIDQLQPGDLIFYGSPIHHVAMYLDGTRVVEAPYTGANVRIREDGLLRSDIVGFGRV